MKKDFTELCKKMEDIYGQVRKIEEIALSRPSIEIVHALEDKLNKKYQFKIRIFTETLSVSTFFESAAKTLEEAQDECIYNAQIHFHNYVYGKEESKPQALAPTSTPEEATEPKEEAPPVAKKAKKVAEKKVEEVKVEPPKGVVYDRTVDLHRNKLGSLLSQICPDWNQDPDKKKAAIDFSLSQNGKILIFDDMGEIHPAFESALETAMGSVH